MRILVGKDACTRLTAARLWGGDNREREQGRRRRRAPRRHHGRGVPCRALRRHVDPRFSRLLVLVRVAAGLVVVVAGHHASPGTRRSRPCCDRDEQTASLEAVGPSAASNWSGTSGDLGCDAGAGRRVCHLQPHLGGPTSLSTLGPRCEPRCRYRAGPQRGVRQYVWVSGGRDQPESGRPELHRIRRRYVLARRFERLLRRRQDLANDALLVVLEWGPPMRLPEPWRLAQRQPKVGASQRDVALADAHEVTRAAYELTAVAWPVDRREVPSEVDRASESARRALAARYPHLLRGSLSRAVDQANYTHAK